MKLTCPAQGSWPFQSCMKGLRFGRRMSQTILPTTHPNHLNYQTTQVLVMLSLWVVQLTGLIYESELTFYLSILKTGNTETPNMWKSNWRYDFDINENPGVVKSTLLALLPLLSIIFQALLTRLMFLNNGFIEGCNGLTYQNLSSICGVSAHEVTDLCIIYIYI